MDGYDVVTTEDERVGKVVGTRGDNLVVEVGTIRRSRRPLPRAYAEVDDAARTVRTTVSKQALEEAPPLDGGLDEAEVDAYYAAGTQARRRAEGSSVEERAEIRSGSGPGQGRLDEPASGRGLHRGFGPFTERESGTDPTTRGSG